MTDPVNENVTDIVARLRAEAAMEAGEVEGLLVDAADEIDRLRVALPDEADRDVMLKGILLSEAARRFLARRRTQQVIAMGFMLDEDATRDLVDASKEAHAARLARVQTARHDRTPEEGS